MYIYFVLYIRMIYLSGCCLYCSSIVGKNAPFRCFFLPFSFCFRTLLSEKLLCFYFLFFIFFILLLLFFCSLFLSLSLNLIFISLLSSSPRLYFRPPHSLSSLSHLFLSSSIFLSLLSSSTPLSLPSLSHLIAAISLSLSLP